MYLTAGQYKGRHIDTPNGARPTLSKVRESIFNILSCFEFESNKPVFFEMFAGSGIMGLEAVSRGYKSFGIDINSDAIKIIKNNYKQLSIIPDIIKCDALKFQTDKKFDIIYLDPPWEFDYEEIIKKAQSFLKPDGIIIVEHDKTKNIDIQAILIKIKSNLEIVKDKRYGRVLVNFLR